MVELIPYQSEWPQIFSDFKNEILSSLEGIVLDVEHIGSTSIQQALAKNIIDVQLGIKTFDDIESLRTVIEGLGFKYLEQIKQDHTPFHDFEHFEPAWEKRLFKGVYKDYDFNVHIRIKNNPNWNFALQFRDYLNSNDDARYAYMQFKQRLADTGIDVKSYCMIKDCVLDIISLQFPLIETKN